MLVVDSKMSFSLVQVATEGDLERLMLLHSAGLVDVKDIECLDAVFAALKFGRVEIVRYLHETCGYKWCMDEWMNAVYSVRSLQYIHEHGCRLVPQAIEFACEIGNLASIMYCHQVGVEWHPDTMGVAASTNRLDIMQYCFANGCKFYYDQKTSTYAAENAALAGHLECLQFCVENQDPTIMINTDRLFACAAENGWLHCLEYLHSKNLFWGSATTSKAAEHGHLECLRYCIENGCEFDLTNCIGYAARNNHNHIFLYIQPYASIVQHMSMFQHDNVEKLKELYGNFAANGGNMVYLFAQTAAERGYLKCLQFCVETGYKFFSSIDRCSCRAAAKNGKIDCLFYLMETYKTIDKESLAYLNKYLEQNKADLDVDKYPIFRKLFKVLDTPIMNSKHNSYVYKLLKAKQEHIECCKQVALKQSSKLPTELVNHVLLQYF